MISPKSVQEILEVSKIEDIVGDYVNLKRSGSNLKGLCPFHNEKTPSFMVSPGKNIFKCFGCGKGGSPASFLMEHERLSFPEALRMLAQRYKIQIEETETTEEQREERQLMESLYLINQFARDFYQNQLFETDRGKSVGLGYFKERGFREETVRKFGLGYAPNSKRAFIEHATKTGYEEKYIEMLGLKTKHGNDFFRSRVMFTIHNLSGKVIGFGGRILEKAIKAPKYINSPETDIYNKSKVLYGAYFAKNAIRKFDECILVEGYTDVLSLHQSGIENVVASSGTSLTQDQIRLIKRFTDNIKIIYDGDAAGVKAALRGLDMVLAQNMNVKIVLLPQGEDPDGYINKVGTTVFREYIESNANDFILFKTKILLKEAQNDPVKKTNLLKNIVKSIAFIPDPLKRSIYIKECSALLNVQEQLLIDAANKNVASILKKKKQQKEREATSVSDTNFPTHEPQIDPREMTTPPPQTQKKIKSGDEFQEKDLVRILVNYGGEIFDEEEQLTVAGFILINIEEVLDEFDSRKYANIVKHCVKMLVEKKEMNKNYFINHPNKEIRQMAIDLMTSPYEYSPNWKEKHNVELKTQPAPDENFIRDSIYAVNIFKLKKVERRIKKNQEELKKAQLANESEKLPIHLKIHMRLLEIRNALAKEVNSVVLKTKIR